MGNTFSAQKTANDAPSSASDTGDLT